MTRRGDGGLSVAAPPDASQGRMAALIFVLTLLFFSFFTFQAIPPADPAQNLYQILTRDLGPRPVYIAYTMLGILFTSAFSALGLPVDVGLNFMSAVFGALGAACAYVLALTLVRDRRIALTAVAITVFSGMYWYQAEIGDFYVTYNALSLLAMVCFVKGRYLYAGGTYAVALLVDPLAALVVPFFLWVAFRERIGSHNFLRFVGASAVIYLPVVGLTLQEYFFGRMGIMPALFVEPVLAEGRLHRAWLQTVSHYGYIYVLSFNVLLLLVVYGVIDTFFRHRTVWLVAMSAALGPMIYTFLNHGSELHDAHLLSAVFFLAVLASLSLWHLVSRCLASQTLQALAVSTCLVMYGGLSYGFVIAPIRNDVTAMKQAFLQLERELPAHAVLISSWGTSLHYNLYTRPFSYDETYPEVMWTGRCHNIFYITAPQFKEWLSSRAPIYLLDGVLWQGPLKEMVSDLLPAPVFRRLSGATPRYQNRLRSFDAQIEFVKMDTFKTKSLVLYQVRPAPGSRPEAVPNNEAAPRGDRDA
jgi:hypothetical protein